MQTTRPEITGTFGVASSTHWLASQTAMAVLEKGGNAFDACVAAGFVLQVVEPHLNGPGGEVPILLWSARRQKVEVICGVGTAPSAATIPHFRQLGLGLVPGIGLLPAAVPGAFGGWMKMLEEHGTWSVAQVLEPAIAYARDGFPLVARAVQAIAAVRPLFTTEWASSAVQWLPGGRLPRPGALLRNPVLARTYERVAREAQQASSTRTGQIAAACRTWYQGFVARAIADFVTTPVRDGSGECHAGLLSLDDMAGWQATVEDPIVLDDGRYTVAKCGPWTQGAVMLQQLGMARHLPLAASGPGGEHFIHLTSEATKLAMADRLAWLGDSGAADVPLGALLDPDYLRARAALIGDRASRELVPGRPGDAIIRLPRLEAADEAIAHGDLRFGAGEPTFAELPPPSAWAERELFVGDTCHVDVIDRHGNMVSATPSGGWLSSSPTVPDLGFALGTRLQSAWLEPGLPNSLMPGRRPCTTLSPTLVLRDGEPYLVCGTPGGDQQDQWQTTFLLRHILFGMNLQEAIDAPAWHIKHFPGSFWPRQTTLNRLTLEARVAPDTIAQLRSRGHEVVVGPEWSEGRLTTCTRTRDDEHRLVLRAAANPRGMQAYAVGR